MTKHKMNLVNKLGLRTGVVEYCIEVERLILAIYEVDRLELQLCEAKEQKQRLLRKLQIPEFPARTHDQNVEGDGRSRHHDRGTSARTSKSYEYHLVN